uniref:hypothetical protein n=1 Tax=Rhizobium mayense TaxID=1312184 RepID=UPI00398C731D
KASIAENSPYRRCTSIFGFSVMVTVFPLRGFKVKISLSSSDLSRTITETPSRLGEFDGAFIKWEATAIRNCNVVAANPCQEDMLRVRARFYIFSPTFDIAVVSNSMKCLPSGHSDFAALLVSAARFGIRWICVFREFAKLLLKRILSIVGKIDDLNSLHRNRTWNDP